jgi:glutamine cyclotransferase
MKRIVIIALLLLAVGAFIFVPLMKGGGATETSMAQFTFKGNIQTAFGSILPVEFKVPEGINKVELIYNDSVFQQWIAPKGNVKFPLAASYYGVGTKMLVLRSYFSDGTSLDDGHLVRVVSDITPILSKASIVNSYPHNATNYTQGLEFNGDVLYEGTGDPGQQGKTVVGKVDLKSGNFLDAKNGLDHNYFGEGITIFGNELFQITWKNQKCFVYDKNTMQLLRENSYTGDGWGLCNDGKYLIMSDGTERIYFRDPKTFGVVKTIEVYDNMNPRVNLNELEYINNRIYANVYMTNTVLVIEPGTGRVLEEIDGSELEVQGKNGGEVMNGIAYHAASNKLYMTGKYWTKLFEVNINPIK